MINKADTIHNQLEVNMKGRKKVGTCKCKKCGHEWHPRPARSHTGEFFYKEPKFCPVCKNPRWNKGPKKFTREVKSE